MLGERSILVRADPVVLFVDPPKIERIVENLVMNGVRQTPAEVAIWVKLWPQDGGAVIALEDDGPGVPNSIRGEIFEPFRQGPPRPHSPSTGIGLSLVAMFAELHDRRVWVEDREGGGASFRLATAPTTSPLRTGEGCHAATSPARPRRRRVRTTAV